VSYSIYRYHVVTNDEDETDDVATQVTIAQGLSPATLTFVDPEELPNAVVFKYFVRATFEDDDGNELTPAPMSGPSNLAVVTAENDAPLAIADASTTNEDTSVAIEVLANDTNVDSTGTPARLRVTSVGPVRGGTAALQPDGRTVLFTPAANGNQGNTPGGFGFSYQAIDTEAWTSGMFSYPMSGASNPTDDRRDSQRRARERPPDRCRHGSDDTTGHPGADRAHRRRHRNHRRESRVQRHRAADTRHVVHADRHRIGIGGHVHAVSRISRAGQLPVHGDRSRRS
jgi:hypothetical protein